MADNGKGGVGNTVNQKGTNQFKRTGHTAGIYGNDPAVSQKNGADREARELKP